MTVVLDMSELSFIDSSGLGLLIRTKQDVEACNGRLMVSRLSAPVKRIVDVAGLNAWFDPVDEQQSKLIPCPVCGDALSPPARLCDRCGSAPFSHVFPALRNLDGNTDEFPMTRPT